MTLGELINKLRKYKEKYGSDIPIANDYGEPLLRVDIDYYMAPHKHNEEADEIEVVQLEFIPIER